MPAVDLADLRARLRLEGGLGGDALPGRRPHVAGVDVEAAVVVVVHEGRAHAGTLVLDPGRRAHLLEADAPAPPSEVVVEVLLPEVVRDQQVGPAVAVVVAPGGGEVVPVVARLQPRLPRGLHEVAVPVVVEEHARGAVARVVVGHGRARLALADPVVERVDAEVEVEEAVAVVVGHRHRHGRAAQPLRELERVGHAREAAGAVVPEKGRPRARGQDQVLVAVVVHVREERLRGVVEDGEARALGHVLEGAVALVAEEPVGEAGRLRDVQVVEAVTVGVTHGDAVVAVRVAGERGVDAGAPGVQGNAELPADVAVSTA